MNGKIVTKFGKGINPITESVIPNHRLTQSKAPISLVKAKIRRSWGTWEPPLARLQNIINSPVKNASKRALQLYESHPIIQEKKAIGEIPLIPQKRKTYYGDDKKKNKNKDNHDNIVEYAAKNEVTVKLSGQGEKELQIESGSLPSSRKKHENHSKWYTYLKRLEMDALKEASGIPERSMRPRELLKVDEEKDRDRKTKRVPNILISQLKGIPTRGTLEPKKADFKTQVLQERQQKKIAGQIQLLLSKEIYGNKYFEMLTTQPNPSIVSVKLSGDMKKGTVFWDPPFEENLEFWKKAFAQSQQHFQNLVHKRIRSKFSPILQFVHDPLLLKSIEKDEDEVAIKKADEFDEWKKESKEFSLTESNKNILKRSKPASVVQKSIEKEVVDAEADSEDDDDEQTSINNSSRRSRSMLRRRSKVPFDENKSTSPTTVGKKVIVPDRYGRNL